MRTCPRSDHVYVENCPSLLREPCGTRTYTMRKKYSFQCQTWRNTVCSIYKAWKGCETFHSKGEDKTPSEIDALDCVTKSVFGVIKFFDAGKPPIIRQIITGSGRTELCAGSTIHTRYWFRPRNIKRA